MLFFTLQLGCALLDSSSLTSRDEASPLDHAAVRIPRRTVAIGSNDSEARPDESPVHSVEVSPFWMDATSDQQAFAFVEATGYTTTAEQPIDWDALKAHCPRHPQAPRSPVDARINGLRPHKGTPVATFTDWWRGSPACWRHPEGPEFH